MLHVLYIIINISCPRKRIENRGMSCNLLRVPTFIVGRDVGTRKRLHDIPRFSILFLGQEILIIIYKTCNISLPF